MATKQMTKSELKVATVRNFLTKFKGQIGMALPKHMTTDRMLRIAMSMFQSNSKFLECDEKTFLKAVVQCSEIGLEPGGVLGHVYLLPYNGNVQVIIGYKGLIELARRSGELESINARIVYEGECEKGNFELEYGFDTTFRHKPLPPSERGDKIIGAYMIAKLKNGGTVFEWMWAEEIEKIRNESPAYKYDKTGSIWNTHREEMFKKTVIRRGMKYMPQCVESQKAAAMDEAGDVGISQGNVFLGDEVIDVEAEEVAAKTKQKAEEFKKIRSEKNGSVTDTDNANEVRKKLWAALLELYGGDEKEVKAFLHNYNIGNLNVASEELIRKTWTIVEPDLLRSRKRNEVT